MSLTTSKINPAIQQKINDMLYTISTLNLRKKDDKQKFIQLLNNYSKDPDILYSSLIYEEELKNDAKYLSTIGDVLLEKQILNKDILKQYKLVKKDYSKSGYYIKPKEEEYVMKGYSLSGTDLPSNLDNIYSYGLYDGLLQQYVVTPEEIKNFPQQYFVKRIEYSKEPTRKTLSVWGIRGIVSQTLPTGQLQEYVNNPELFLKTALDIKSKVKTIQKVNTVFENLYKYYLAEYLYKLYKGNSIYAKRIHAYYSELKEIIEKKGYNQLLPQLLEYIRVNKLEDKKFRPFEAAKYLGSLNLGNNTIYFEYKELLDKNVILQDMRAKENRQKLVAFIEYIKSTIRNKSSLAINPDKNIMIKKIRDKELLNNEKYQKITKNVEFEKIAIV